MKITESWSRLIQTRDVNELTWIEWILRKFRDVIISNLSNQNEVDRVEEEIYPSWTWGNNIIARNTILSDIHKKYSEIIDINISSEPWFEDLSDDVKRLYLYVSNRKGSKIQITELLELSKDFKTDLRDLNDFLDTIWNNSLIRIKGYWYRYATVSDNLSFQLNYKANKKPRLAPVERYLPKRPNITFRTKYQRARYELFHTCDVRDLFQPQTQSSKLINFFLDNLDKEFTVSELWAEIGFANVVISNCLIQIKNKFIKYKRKEKIERVKPETYKFSLNTTDVDAV